MNFSTLALRVLKASDFVAFDGQPAPKPSMSTRCLPAETPGAQGLAGFPRGSPSTFPSTHFFAPIPETPAIAAKVFEISQNVWGYDNRLFDPFLQHFLRFAQRQDFDGRPPQRADVHKQKKIEPKRGKIYDAAEPETEISERRVTLYEKVTRSGAGAGHVHVPRHHQQRSLFR